MVPKTSPWFQFFPCNVSAAKVPAVLPWQLEPSYIGDWTGLRTLQESGRLVHGSVPCGHQDVPRATCLNDSYAPYAQLLNNTIGD